jgi:uncharacterized protein (DUF2236 family)
MALAGLRALLLQAVHPLAMAGVAQHSDFRGDPWGRRSAPPSTSPSSATARPRRRRARPRAVRGIHRKLSGIEPESGTAYRVDDPELLLWVHCCEVESFLSTALRCGMRLTPRSATPTTPSRSPPRSWSASRPTSCRRRSSRCAGTSSTCNRT